MPDWTYELTDEDHALAKRLAERRDDGKPDTCHNGQVATAESVQRHAAGLRGEIAFARIFGYEVDRERRETGDDGSDFTTPEGMTVDVKYRSEPGSDLALEGVSFNAFNSHFLVLSWQERDSVRLVGWCTAARMALKGKVGAWGDVGRKRYIEPGDLAKMDVLYAMIALT